MQKIEWIIIYKDTYLNFGLVQIAYDNRDLVEETVRSGEPIVGSTFFWLLWIELIVYLLTFLKLT